MAPLTTGNSSPCANAGTPIIGNGEGVTSFIHLDDAAAATVLALEHDGAAIYNIVDDDPAPLREWVPVLANILGAKPPRRIPVWLARLIAGEAGVIMGTQTRGASNAKAKLELGWKLRYPSWRQGFVAAYASGTPPGGRKADSSPEHQSLAGPDGIALGHADRTQPSSSESTRASEL
jgi:nucleoside-diphosphate-sugar epimerase